DRPWRLTGLEARRNHPSGDHRDQHRRKKHRVVHDRVRLASACVPHAPDWLRLNSGGPRWECFANFWRTNTSIGGAPASIDRAQFDDPISVMLGIRKYAATDLSTFSGFDANAAALDYIRKEAVRVEDEMFNVLRAIVDGENPKPTSNLGYSLATRPE